MAHVLLFGDEAQCASIRTQLVRWGLTVSPAAGGAPTFESVGVDVCDVVIVVGDLAAGALDPDTVSDGGRGAVAAAPRCFLSDAAAVVKDPRALRADVQEACRLAQERRAGWLHPDVVSTEDVHQVGHELRSPLTAIKTALEVMEGDLCSWHAEPADIEAQLKMLQIALRNVRRLHRAVEWSQMLLAGPRADADPLTAECGDHASVPSGPEADLCLQACGSGAG